MVKNLIQGRYSEQLYFNLCELLVSAFSINIDVMHKISLVLRSIFTKKSLSQVFNMSNHSKWRKKLSSPPLKYEKITQGFTRIIALFSTSLQKYQVKGYTFKQKILVWNTNLVVDIIMKLRMTILANIFLFDLFYARIHSYFTCSHILTFTI